MQTTGNPPGAQPSLCAVQVLVTGADGFIGSHLVEALLARGERVVCLDNFNDYYAPAIKRDNVAAALSDAPEGGHCQAALAASIFHFRETTVIEVKERLLELGVSVRPPT